MLLEKEEFKTPQVRRRGHLTIEERKQLNYLKRKEKVTPLDKAERYELMELEHKAGLYEARENKKCVICGDDIQGYGNNADPVADGICCDKCNASKVIPARLSIINKREEALTEGKNLDDIIYDALSRIKLKGDDGKPRHPEVYANPKGNGYRLEIEDDESGIDQVASIAKKYKLNYNIRHMRDYTEITVDLPERKFFDESYKVVDKDGNKVPQGGGFTSKREAEMFAVQYGEKDLKVVKESFEDEHLGTSVEETPEPGPEAGIASLINKLIIDEWEAIQGYNDAIVAAETEGYSNIANVLRDIANEENLHVGQLEQCMQQLSPNAESINQGEVEADEQLGTGTIFKESLSTNLKDEIELIVKGDFETGHVSAEDYNEFRNLFRGESINPTEELYNYYVELRDLGPTGFYQEFKNKYDFDELFVQEFGDEDDEDPEEGMHY